MATLSINIITHYVPFRHYNQFHQIIRKAPRVHNSHKHFFIPLVFGTNSLAKKSFFLANQQCQAYFTTPTHDSQQPSQKSPETQPTNTDHSSKFWWLLPGSGRRRQIRITKDGKLSWDDYFWLRVRRRNTERAFTIPSTLLGFGLSTGYVVTRELDPTPILGQDPAVIYGLSILLCLFSGLLIGPVIGSGVWKLFHRREVKLMEERDREFYAHIKTNRADPSLHSIRNPAPDYYALFREHFTTSLITTKLQDASKLALASLLEKMDLFHKYDDAIVKNASQINSIESSLRMLTYVLPGRFEDSELASEALFAALNLIGLYHDSILVRAAAANLPSAKRPTPSSHNRYTRYWINSSKSYKTAAFLLTLLQCTDVLMEMSIQKKYGKEVKWNFITAIETIKTFCRFVLLYRTRSRIVVQPSIPRREIDPAIFNEDQAKESPSAETTETSWFTTMSEEKNETWTGTRTGHKRLHISAVGQHNIPGNNNRDVFDYLTKRVLMVEDVRNPKDLINIMNFIGSLGEILYILRPLIYVISIRKYGNQSWMPWLASFAIEASSRLLIDMYYKKSIPGGYRWLSSLEKEEYKRRSRQFFYYFLRNPFYSKFTKQKIDAFCNAVSTKPILSLLGGILRDYQPLIENLHYYTASS
ncbi:11113_t:CDS:2 [Ambispora leptoticha]|uniref:11113_t:CDS:1 n=1 Tax=Ambispora leptoticha TaxID=144679 RepID=A0A9N9BG00_9GLOM|nr:11113_t:CDS:2 [Ambispora leptoticha]